VATVERINPGTRHTVCDHQKGTSDLCADRDLVIAVRIDLTAGTHQASSSKWEPPIDRETAHVNMPHQELALIFKPIGIIRGGSGAAAHQWNFLPSDGLGRH